MSEDLSLTGKVLIMGTVLPALAVGVAVIGTCYAVDKGIRYAMEKMYDDEPQYEGLGL